MSESEKWSPMLKAMASVLPADPYAPITPEMVQEAMRRAQAATQEDYTEDEQRERFASYGQPGDRD